MPSLALRKSMRWMGLLFSLTVFAPHFHMPLDAPSAAPSESGAMFAAPAAAAESLPDENAPGTFEGDVSSCALCRASEGQDAARPRPALAPTIDRPWPSLLAVVPMARRSNVVRLETARAPPLRLHI